MAPQNQNLRQKYPRKDASGRHWVIDHFTSFLSEVQRTLPDKKGCILNIISQKDKETDLGGLGKTHETWNLLEYFEEGKRRMEVIDLSSDKDRFGFIKEVAENLEVQLSDELRELPDGSFEKPYQYFKDLGAILNIQTQLIEDTLSNLAWEKFKVDIKRIVNSGKLKGKPMLLFFDSLDWVVDDELLKNRKTAYPEKIDWKIQDKNPQKGSILDWLLGPDGLFRTLLGMPVSLVLTGRYALADITEGNPFADEIFRVVEIGGFTLEDLKSYLQKKLEGIPTLAPNKLPHQVTKENLGELLAISMYKPVLAVAAADYISNQFRKRRENVLKEKLWDKIEEIKANHEEKERHKEFMLYLNDQLFEVTGSYDSSMILWGATLAFYRLDAALAEALIYRENAEDVFKNMSGLSLIKRYPHQKTNKPFEFLRPHDDILVEFHENFWNRDRELKENWYQKILDFYEQKSNWPAGDLTLSQEMEDSQRKRIELYYLTYLFEAANASGDKEKIRQKLEKAARYAQFIFIENIDQHPDHAERILSRAEIYLPFDRGEFFVEDELKMSPFREWLAFRRIEYWLTERNADSVREARQRLLKMKASLPSNEDTNPDMLNIVDGYLGELDTWQNNFEDAKKYLENSGREIFSSGNDLLLVWVRHLQGFVSNRSSDFISSGLYNSAVLNGSLPYFLNSIKDFDKILKEKPEAILFLLNERETFRFRRIIRLFLRSMGNLAAMSRYSGKQFLAIKYSFDQIYLWNAFPHADREIARAYANLLISLHTIELEEVVKNLGIYAGSTWLQKFKKDNLIKMRLQYAEAVSEYKKGGVGYVNVHLKEKYPDFLKSETLEKGGRKKQIENALRIASEGIQLQKDKEGNSLPVNRLLGEVQLDSPLPREIADLYYLSAKIHICKTIDDVPDYEGASIACRNALAVAEKSKFRYLELKALEGLTLIAYLRGEEQAFADWKGKFERFKEEAPEFTDILGKYYNTIGNDHFSEVLNNSRLRNSKEAEDELIKAIKAYCLMLDYGLSHNQDRYDLALKVIASRIGDFNERSLRTLISGAKNSFLDGLKTTEAYKKDRYLKDYVEGLFKGVELIAGFVDGEVEKKFLEELESLQRLFLHAGMDRKCIEINRLLKNYYCLKAEETKGIRQLEKAILAYYRFVYLFQRSNQSQKAEGVLEDAGKFLEKFHNPGFNLDGLFAILDIAKTTIRYRTNEFWIVERFISGEEIHYKERHAEFEENRTESGKLSNEKLPPAQTIRNALIVLAKYCKNLTSDEERLPFYSILSEGCYRLGEFYMLIGNTGLKQKGFKLPKEDNAVFRALSSLYSSERIQNRVERGGSFFLEYARDLAALTHDIHWQTNILQSIYNYWYLQKNVASGQDLEDQRRLMHTVKAYSLSFPTLAGLFEAGFKEKGIDNNENLRLPADFRKSSFNELRENYKSVIDHTNSSEKQKLIEIFNDLKNDSDKFSLKEKVVKCVRYLSDLQDQMFGRSEYESPFIFSKLKMVMGNKEFSRYFEPDNARYREITDQLQGTGEFTGRLLLERCKLTEFGLKKKQEFLEHKNKPESKPEQKEFGSDMRKMFYHYLEGLDALATDTHFIADFYLYLLEIQRRILLIPEKEAISEILKILDIGWYQFRGLRFAPEILDEIKLSLNCRLIALNLEEIYK